jgi:hypothetical protein
MTPRFPDAALRVPGRRGQCAEARPRRARYAQRGEAAAEPVSARRELSPLREAR